jgi:hypothetical protein
MSGCNRLLRVRYFGFQGLNFAADNNGKVIHIATFKNLFSDERERKLQFRFVSLFTGSQFSNRFSLSNFPQKFANF